MTMPIPATPDLCPTPDDRGLGALLGLVEGRQRALPLAEVRVRAHLLGAIARTEVVQRFHNHADQPMEAVYLFPLPADGAVTAVELRAGEVVVRAVCREKAEAEATFEQAREQGHRAALLTQDRADVYTLRVTNLPPGEEVRVAITVVERLEVVDGLTRWRFPTTIPPRYLPGTPTGHDGPGVLPDTDRVPDASRLQPPLRLEGGTALDLEVEVAGPVARLQSSLHAIRLDLDAEAVRVAPSTRATLDRDFVLAYAAPPDQASAWTDGTHTLVQIEPPEVGAPTLPRDAVFVVDISGSMGGTKMKAAKLALRTALHGLLPGDRFTVIAFDDRVERFSAQVVPYDDVSLKRATTWVKRLRARGGTEMLPAIQAALEGDTPEGRLRTVLFITDGQVWNEAELAAAVANRLRGARLFTLGIDTAVNARLLTRLARVGGGTCELCTPEDDIEAVISRVEARFGSPVVLDVAVEGAAAARPEPGVLFAGRPLTVLAQGGPEAVVAVGRTSAGEWRREIPVRKAPLALGELWARERVDHLEDRIDLRPWEAEAVRGEVLRIALEHGIASRFTAFVAVETSRKVTGERVEVVQPVELPDAWDADQFRGPPPGLSLRLDAAMAMPSPRRAGAARRARAPRAKRSGVLDLLSRIGRSSAPRAAAPAEESVADSFDGSEDAFTGTFGAKLEEGRGGGARALGGEERAAGREEAKADPAGALARRQGADGSFGGDLRRTAAALLALVLLGHTRRGGLRRRAVTKAAAWLQRHREDPLADLALSALEAAEAGQSPAPDGRWSELSSAGEEGRALHRALVSHGS